MSPGFLHVDGISEMWLANLSTIFELTNFIKLRLVQLTRKRCERPIFTPLCLGRRHGFGKEAVAASGKEFGTHDEQTRTRSPGNLSKYLQKAAFGSLGATRGSSNSVSTRLYPTVEITTFD